MKSKKIYSIDNMPIALFDSILKTGNYSLLEGVKESEKEKQWIKVFDEYLVEFGINEAYKKYLQLQSEAIDLYNDAYNKGQKYKATLAEVKTRQAEEALIDTKGGSFDLSVAMVSKFMGFRVDPKTTTVKEFYYYLKMANSTR